MIMHFELSSAKCEPLCSGLHVSKPYLLCSQVLVVTFAHMSTVSSDDTERSFFLIIIFLVICGIRRRELALLKAEPGKKME